MNLVKLLDKNKDEIWVNPEKVVAVESKGGVTYVKLVSSNHATEVQGDITEVIKRLKRIK